METIAVERSIRIAAPRERVWQAITDPNQLAQWFVPNLPGAVMKRDDNGKITVELGPMSVDFLILEVTDAPRQATIRNLPDRLVAATYTLEEEQGGTRVMVTMSGFEALPADARQDRLQLSSAAWEQTLENLNAYVGGEALPFPTAFVGPLFGYWREAREKFAVERSIWIAASREQVWRALTDPTQVQEWFSPGTVWKSSGSGVGAKLYVENPETGGEMYVQVLEVVEPPHRLVLRSLPEEQETPKVTAYTLEEENGGTRLTLTHSGYELDAEDVRRTSMEQNAFGFGMMLENLKAHIEGKSVPYPQGF